MCFKEIIKDTVNKVFLWFGLILLKCTTGSDLHVQSISIKTPMALFEELGTSKNVNRRRPGIAETVFDKYSSWSYPNLISKHIVTLW